MTNESMKKMHGASESVRRALVWAAGAAEALLLARLLARLLAARPDNPAIVALYAVTGPLIAPLSWLDLAQHRFGAVLELATLSSAILMPMIAYLLWAWLGGRAGATVGGRGSS
jgi:hypothetical protein